MKFLDRLESRLQIPQLNITYYLLGLQILGFIIIRFYPNTEYFFILKGTYLFQGQWWRVFTYIMEPFSLNTISAALSWYMYYFLGTALEKHWLTFRYALYLLIPYIGTLICALIFPQSTYGNGLIFTSVLLAFTTLFPEVTVRIFFIIPIKVKWIGVVVWIGIIGLLISSPFPQQISVLVSILN